MAAASGEANLQPCQNEEMGRVLGEGIKLQTLYDNFFIEV